MKLVNLLNGLFLLSLPVLTGPASAQGKVAHTLIEVYEQTADGQVSTCGLDYTIIHSEHLYRNNQLVGLRGSLSWTAVSGHRLLMIHKATGVDFDPSTSKPTAFPLNYDFISTDTQSYAGKETKYFAGENGGKVAGYELPLSGELFLALYQLKPFYINYNRVAGGQDVSVPLVVSGNVTATDGNKFKNCMDAVLAKAKAE